MQISLIQPDEPLHFERIVLYPYPDLKRIWTRVWLNTLADPRPNIEIVVRNPDGSENTSVFAMTHAEQKLETTLHLRHPRAGATYHVSARLTVGLTEQPELVEQQDFALLLEFRDPQRGEPGFGVGVDWAEVQQKAQGAGL
jgi:hypothetical protein